MSLPRDISPGTAARRSLLADLLAALVLTLLAFQLAAGIGVVGFMALLTLLALVAWIAIEAIAHGTARRRRTRRERAVRAATKRESPT
ncbi:MAG: hypothetical protein QOF13_531 [Solirubrobacterales bacterium]|nr:hypothetical protein [Solirubrobacterales bacterium]